FYFGSSPIKFRPIASVTWTLKPSRSWSRLPGRRAGLRTFQEGWLSSIRDALLLLRGRSWFGNGTGNPIGSWSYRTVLPGTARPSLVFLKSPWPSPAPSGTARASSACGIGGPNRRVDALHDGGINRQGSMRHLHAGFGRPGTGSGLQLAGCAV